MKIKFGPDKGNEGALIRWGTYLDNGIWLCPWKYRKLWTRFRFMRGYWNFGIFHISWGNTGH